MVNAIQNLNITYFAFNSNISFYAAKSYSRQLLQNTFQIESILDGYSLEISMFKRSKDVDDGVISFKSNPRIQFVGELLEFDYSELSESESTVVFKGDLKILYDKKKKTFLGSIKKIDDTIILKANLSLSPSEFEFEKVLNCSKSFKSAKAINVAIMLKLKD
ncbi:MAG: hypothetical protein QM478_12980 [Flavobacteriaceae bacterium]